VARLLMEKELQYLQGGHREPKRPLAAIVCRLQGEQARSAVLEC